jgi:RNA polymerase sigma-70 factor, ECF subfamily
VNEKNPETSESLIFRIRNPSDTDAWSAFAEIYSPMIRRYCQKKGLQEADALDVTQEVLLKVNKAIGNFDYERDKGRFRSWLGTITVNEIHSNWKRTKRIPSNIDLDFTDVQKNDPEWNQEFTDHILSLAVDRIRNEFSLDVWSTFEATWMLNEPSVDVAAKHGVAIHTVYVNKSRVLKRLMSEVKKLSEDIPSG